MKFKNKTDFQIRVATLDGHCAVFEAGEELQVPAVMKAACLAMHLTLTEGADEVADTAPVAKKVSSRKGKKDVVVAAEAVAAEMGENLLQDVE